MGGSLAIRSAFSDFLVFFADLRSAEAWLIRKGVKGYQMSDETLRKAVTLALESILRGAANPCEALSTAKGEIEMMMVKMGDDPDHLALLKLIHEEIKARVQSC